MHLLDLNIDIFQGVAYQEKKCQLLMIDCEAVSDVMKNVFLSVSMDTESISHCGYNYLFPKCLGSPADVLTHRDLLHKHK